ncbi:actin cytoskeleton-regulatory complex protein pan1 [Impatiens glandulifera]|uniref:actin cytoskeleton-regulatory complex protein pan1 n=1 Tax=Impatiens glandulifera TaxID=253017 RepID=UPI001FB120D6|nr:actin cytoskeleton-regulatory complex protein pan1 [Impatiens glandulifera]
MAAMDLFEAYFQRADLDRDGRISGNEAVAFFQGSGLSKPVLAQIWMNADQRQSGFLGRAEFYNALKLVTVAQSKRELTPDMVKAALYGPASAKIPPPQINLAALAAPQPNAMPAAPQPNAMPAAPQPNAMLAAPVPQIGAVTRPTTPNLGFRGQAPQITGMNQQYFPSQGNQTTRPPLVSSAVSAPQPSQVGIPDFPRGGNPAAVGFPNSNVSGGWLGGNTSGMPSGVSLTPDLGMTRPTASATAKPLDSLSAAPFSATKPSQARPSSMNMALDPSFGGDVFSASQSLSKNNPLALVPSMSSASAPVNPLPVANVSQSSSKADPFQSLQSGFSRPLTGGLQQVQSIPKQIQPVPSQNFTSHPPSAVPTGPGNSALNQPQIQWPKMTSAGVQKYMKVFVEVDTDRDGKITGEQARSLFLSWRLPREILRQVWDLSDQDNDSMLSLREFCIALYLLERFREGRPLPPTLPSNVLLDETLLSLTGQPTAYGGSSWGATAGFRPQQGIPGSQPMAPAAGPRPPIPATVPHNDRNIQFNQEKSLIANSNMEQRSNGEPNSADPMFQEMAEPVKKIEDKDKLILDSKEKLEFYRTKMQDLVLYKSRCDNRLNEITERAIADKRESELLGKKYEEKYKQVAEGASKLTIEEATFRDIQERKTELSQAIIKVEQGGSVDGLLQVRADRIQSELEELVKALTERCKKHGIDVKSSAVIELPTGWQPGIPEVAAVWDEDWDKFEDEGFLHDVSVPTKESSASLEKENYSPNGSLSSESLSRVDGASDKHFVKGDNSIQGESAYAHSDNESGKSPSGSPIGQTAFDSPYRDYSDDHFKKSPDADREAHSGGGFDEQMWGSFDNNDDIDSVWGFNTDNTKGSGFGNHGEKQFDSSPKGGSSSPHTENAFRNKSLFNFEDSVPNSPLSRAGNSPSRFSVGSTDHFFDNNRFDSFNDHGFSSSSRPETLSRFDSVNSSHGNFDIGQDSRSGFDHNQGTLSRFDSINSTKGYDHSRGFSFDDSDPFGSSGPFKVSSENETPKKSRSDNWNAF